MSCVEILCGWSQTIVFINIAGAVIRLVVLDVGVVRSGFRAERLVLPLRLDLLLDGDLLLVWPVLRPLVKALLRPDRARPHINLILFVVFV